MPHIGGRFGVSFIEKGGKYGTLEGKGTASVKKKGRYCINMELRRQKYLDSRNDCKFSQKNLNF